MPKRTVAHCLYFTPQFQGVVVAGGLTRAARTAGSALALREVCKRHPASTTAAVDGLSLRGWRISLSSRRIEFRQEDD
jgi:hypothetical protein